MVGCICSTGAAVLLNYCAANPAVLLNYKLILSAFCIDFSNLRYSIMAAEKKVILVTGGTGLVGKAIEAIAREEEKRSDEEWFFASSKDGDLS